MGWRDNSIISDQINSIHINFDARHDDNSLSCIIRLHVSSVRLTVPPYPLTCSQSIPGTTQKLIYSSQRKLKRGNCNKNMKQNPDDRESGGYEQGKKEWS